MSSILSFRPSRWVMLLTMAGLLLALPTAQMLAEPYYVTLLARVMVFAIAAVSLNLILGFGGLVSFGHALYFGLGAYVVGIAGDAGLTNGWVQMAITLALCGSVAVITGVLCLRASGIGFIMITLAFAQTFYFLFVSLKQFGGDDGLSIPQRSQFAPGLSFADAPTLYVVLWLVLGVILLCVHVTARARFGMVLRGCKVNERRMVALGFPTLRYKLYAYALSAMMCGVAGFFYGNLTGYVSPAYMSWPISGELIVMAVLGGMGTVFGPVVGAGLFLLLEEGFKLAAPDHWMAIMGLFIVAIVLLTRDGLYGYLHTLDRRSGAQS